MIDKRIEYFKELLTNSQALITDEQLKIIEYEQILSHKKNEYKSMSFIKKFFDKEKNEEINKIIELIQNSSLVINQTKETVKKEREEFLSDSVYAYINQDKEKVIVYNKLQSTFKRQKQLYEVVLETHSSGKNALEWLESAIKDLNEYNTANDLGFSDGYHDIMVNQINSKFSKTIRCILHFKKMLKYTAVQLKTIDENIDTTNLNHMSDIMNDDQSEHFTLKNTLRHINGQSDKINNSLSCLQTTNKLLTNEANKYYEKYKLAQNAYNNFLNDVNLIVKSNLEEIGVKI